MAYELKDGSGSMFPNKYHEKGDNKPVYRGEAMWRGEKIEIACWVKEGKSGKFLSLKLQEPRESQPQAQPPRTDRAPQRPADDSEIPF